MDYKELIIKVIEQGNYVLADMEQRITRLWLEGKLSEADRDELIPMAAEHAADRYQVDVIAELADLRPMPVQRRALLHVAEHWQD